ncbi:MAG: radical SAM protein [Cryobacterium sp.]|nr:radical SAM protein [Oligoflexia bacterium]
MQAKKYSLKTLGCKANLYDSQLIEAELQKRGWTPAGADELADLCVVNSCTVTDEADKQSRKMAAKAARHPGTRVVMTGCGAEIEPEKFAAATGVDFIVGNQSKNRLVDLVLAEIEKSPLPSDEFSVRGKASVGKILGGVTSYSDILSRHPMDREWATPESSFMLPPAHLRGDTGRTRAFIKIQEGCDSFCTYCIIPYGRGPGRSLPIVALIEQVRDLVSQGVREIVLTGTNIGDYGADLADPVKPAGKPMLENLVTAILAETDLERLRISSLDPVEITPELRAIYAENPRLCAHFHVSLQSPHSKVLRLMKRKYVSTDVESCLNAISELPAPIGGVFAGMDVITGFPGEGLAEFEWGVDQLRALPWTRLHVFPYSERAGTPATRLPNTVPPSERVRRAKVLRDLSLERMKRIHHQVLTNFREHGRKLDRVLIEGPVKGPDPTQNYVGGYSSNYLRAILRVESEAAGEALRNQSLSLAPVGILVDSNQGDVALLCASP